MTLPQTTIDRIELNATEYATSKYGIYKLLWGPDLADWNKCKNEISSLLTTEATKAQKLAEALEELTTDRYPETVFTPLTEFELKVIGMMFANAGIHLDRYSAHVARLLLAPIIKRAEEALKQYQE